MKLCALALGALLCLLQAACSPFSANPSAATVDPAQLDWSEIISQARGTTVHFFLWGGDERINRYVGEFIAPRLSRKYGITLVRTPLADTAEAVNKVLGERAAGKTTGGSIDLIWINGENFRTMRQGDLLYGPWARRLPNAALIPWSEPTVSNDFGTPVEGYEAPWGRAQFVLIYDSARVSEPPRSLAQLLAWARAHPGRFTYPAPPDFTGSAFVRHAFYELAENPGVLARPFDQQSFARQASRVWAYFNELRPLQWRAGETFPQSVEQLNRLFANGEVDLAMSYTPAFASGAIQRGIFPPTTRTYLLTQGTLANTHYVAIPFNASNKAGAMVVANALQSPQAQLEKARPGVWGDLPAISAASLSPELQDALEGISVDQATLPLEVLAANALVEPDAEWITHIERGWQEHVLKRR